MRIHVREVTSVPQSNTEHLAQRPVLHQIAIVPLVGALVFHGCLRGALPMMAAS